MKRPSPPTGEQLRAFDEMPTLPAAPHEPSPDTMRQIVSLRMPDALLARVEEVAASRGVSPSSLMRAYIAAGLDRSYAAVTPDDLSTELQSLRRAVEEVAARLRNGD